MNVGRVVQVIGPTIDVEFDTGKIPEIYSAITIDEKVDGIAIKLTAEVQQQIGRNQVKAIAMSSTDGVVRGMKVVDTGGPKNGVVVADMTVALLSWFHLIVETDGGL
jgi:F-type H+-transporting ATPase subunit beta